MSAIAICAACATPAILKSNTPGPCGDTDQFCEVCPNGDYCHSSWGGHCDEVTGSCAYSGPPVIGQMGATRDGGTEQ